MPGAQSTKLHVAYSPVAPVYGGRKLGANWALHAIYLTVRPGFCPKPFSIVKPTTVLYIVAHGAGRNSTIPYNARNRMDARTLAPQMRPDRLMHFVRKIKFYGCSGALGGAHRFISQILSELREIHYNNIEVYGYVSTLSSLDGNGRKYGSETIVTDDEQGNMILYEKKVRVSAEQVKIEG
jgi:hypothetical protein